MDSQHEPRIGLVSTDVNVSNSERSINPRVPLSFVYSLFIPGAPPNDLLQFRVDKAQPLSINAMARSIGKIDDAGNPWVNHGLCCWLADLDRLLGQIYSSSPEDSWNRMEAVYRASLVDQEARLTPDNPRLSVANFERIRLCSSTENEQAMNLEGLTEPELKEYRLAVQQIAPHRQPLSIDSSIFLGIGLQEGQPGDIIFVFQVCAFPYLVPTAGESNTFRLLGEAYVHGIMDGGWNNQNGAVKHVPII